MAEEQDRLTRERELEAARERLRSIIDQYIRTEEEVRALEQGEFRVVIFGSARMRPEYTEYKMVYRIAHALAEQGIDIVTGGGPGLMEAANRAVLDVAQRHSQSYGLTIEIPALKEPANKHLDIKSSHRRFTSRLDEFMRLSNAVIVAPGGIGTLLELAYVWQLLQVGMTNDRPVILLGKAIWGGLLDWMNMVMVEQGYVSKEDMRWITLVDTEKEAIDLITVAHHRFLQMEEAHVLEEQELDTAVTSDVLMASAPTEVSEEGTEAA
ncbi:MAG: LOG family protein [Armatimonadota bacterium]